MKIGILTYHRAHNYGAMLQAFALKTFLESLGQDVTIIDYDRPEHIQLYRNVRFWYKGRFTPVQALKQFVKDLLIYPAYRKRRKAFEQFIQNYLGISSPAVRYTFGDQIAEAYDCVVYGSDQIWRKEPYAGVNAFNDTFWGYYPVNTKRRIAYAASMGVLREENEDLSYVEKAIRNFDLITVREADLQTYLAKIGFEVPVVLDPVFLLSQGGWMKKLSLRPKSEKRYLLVYDIHRSTALSRFAERLSAQEGCEIVALRELVKYEYQTAENVCVVGPDEFLNLLANATYVVTSSFHAVAFSILFQKNFYFLGLNTNTNRIKTLLASFGLDDRLIGEDFDSFLADIDYSEVTAQVDKLSERSRSILSQMIQDKLTS